jgi:ADP-ribose diphosphatase
MNLRRKGRWYSLPGASMTSSARLPLPRLPDVGLDDERTSSFDSQTPFLHLERLRLVLDGSRFSYDVVTRKALDSVVMAAHYERDGVPWLVLRSAVRVPLWHRQRTATALWELPAGLVEPGELPRDGAARELLEEVGARVSSSELLPLGPPVYPAPGMVAELQWFFHVRIDPFLLETAHGDSSALEQASVLAHVSLKEALALCAAGQVPDAKTELGLRRLGELLC